MALLGGRLISSRNGAFSVGPVHSSGQMNKLLTKAKGMGYAVFGAVVGCEAPDYRVISTVRVRLMLISWPRLMSFRSARSLLCSITWLPFW